MNSPQYGGGAVCGMCIRLNGTQGSITGTRILIIDDCTFAFVLPHLLFFMKYVRNAFAAPLTLRKAATVAGQ